MVKISKANFGDLSEKKAVFIEFLEIIQSKQKMRCQTSRAKDFLRWSLFWAGLEASFRTNARIPGGPS